MKTPKQNFNNSRREFMIIPFQFIDLTCSPSYNMQFGLRLSPIIRVRKTKLMDLGRRSFTLGLIKLHDRYLGPFHPARLLSITLSAFLLIILNHITHAFPVPKTLVLFYEVNWWTQTGSVHVIGNEVETTRLLRWFWGLIDMHELNVFHRYTPTYKLYTSNW